MFIGPPSAGNGVINSNNTGSPHTSAQLLSIGDHLVETKIEDGKLLYERKWFHRGQSVFVEGRDFPKIAATISAIGTEVVSFN